MLILIIIGVIYLFSCIVIGCYLSVVEMFINQSVTILWPTLLRNILAIIFLPCIILYLVLSYMIIKIKPKNKLFTFKIK